MDQEKEPEVWVMVSAWYGKVSTGGQAGFALDKLTELLGEKYPEDLFGLFHMSDSSLSRDNSCVVKVIVDNLITGLGPSFYTVKT